MAQMLNATQKSTSGLRGRWATYRSYRNTLNELSMLSDRELSDLGMSRSSLRSIALEAHYKV